MEGRPVWQRNQGGPDDADDEATPAGDGTPGDGLTLYEEYRGFYENGTHIEGDPTKKDFFLVDQTGGLAAGGIAKLQRIVKLAVHGNLAPGELPDDRVINKNTKQGAHVVAQHGVVLAVDGALSGVAEARGGPSNPKRISLVALPSDTGAWEPSYMAASVAHELLHAINVWHHGDSDREATWRVGTDGVLREFYLLGPSEGIVIKVLTETGIDVTAILARSMGASGAPVWVGMKQGQHSGFENCVMRYDNANAYVSDADPTVRYFVTELTGHALCDSISGTSVNAPGRTPQSRYGVAQVGRGICLQQILVTDAIVAPKR